MLLSVFALCRNRLQSAVTNTTQWTSIADCPVQYTCNCVVPAADQNVSQ